MKLLKPIPTTEVLDAIADGVFIVDTNFTIIGINKAALNILAVEQDEALGSSCSELFHASVCEDGCVLRETFATGKPIVNRPVYIVNSEGRRISVTVSTSVIRDNSGSIIAGIETFRDVTEIETLRKKIQSDYSFEDIISRSSVMHSLFEVIPDVALSGSTVLLTGESGTGKELFARAIHVQSDRKGAFVVVNASALPETLVESELFGYAKGAFTGAVSSRSGRIAQAEGGTLFLDEIGDLSPAIQVKLLRFLQFKEYEVLGTNQTVKADVRIITATKHLLKEKVADGSFRDDLFYRISVFHLHIPTLKERIIDVPLLVAEFVRRCNAEKNKTIEGFSSEALALLMNYNFPGNIRELENIVEYACVMCKEQIVHMEHLPENFKASSASLNDTPTLNEHEAAYIQSMIEACAGNKRQAAEKLGIDPSTLWRKLKRLEQD